MNSEDEAGEMSMYVTALRLGKADYRAVPASIPASISRLQEFTMAARPPQQQRSHREKRQGGAIAQRNVYKSLMRWEGVIWL